MPLNRPQWMELCMPILTLSSNYRMLVYAIVLILVMLATNNPTLKGFFSRLFHRERADAPHAAAVKGGGKQ